VRSRVPATKVSPRLRELPVCGFTAFDISVGRGGVNPAAIIDYTSDEPSSDN